jgi:hypothetical protein
MALSQVTGLLVNQESADFAAFSSPLPEVSEKMPQFRASQK